MSKREKSLVGYIGRYWGLYWEDEDGKVNGKGMRKIKHLPIYKTLKDGCFPIATGYPIKVRITIKEV